MNLTTEHHQIVEELTGLFQPHTIYLVGGSVRDILLGNKPKDLDFTTSAPPEVTAEKLRIWGDAYWETGIAYGTVAAKKNGIDVEVTTMRDEWYDYDSRKPRVQFGDNLWLDLERRDFTINAMALRHTGNGSYDIYSVPEAMKDLEKKVLRTPGLAHATLKEDPLRIIRAARFVAQLPGFTVSNDVLKAMSELSSELSRVAGERIIMELDKLLMSEKVFDATYLMEQTGVTAQLAPEALTWPSIDKIPAVLETRWAAWLVALEAEEAHRILRRLKHNSHMCRTVPKIIELCDRFAGVDQWTPAKVRKFAFLAGDLLGNVMSLVSQLPLLVTDEFLSLFWTTPVDNLRIPVGGEFVMKTLGISQGKLVGSGLIHLQYAWLEHGGMTEAEMVKELKLWWEGKA